MGNVEKLVKIYFAVSFTGREILNLLTPQY